MSTLRRFAVGLLIVVLCAGSAYAQTARIRSSWSMTSI
jgi:hypothetical protein